MGSKAVPYVISQTSSQRIIKQSTVANHRITMDSTDRYRGPLYTLFPG